MQCRVGEKHFFLKCLNLLHNFLFHKNYTKSALQIWLIELLRYLRKCQIHQFSKLASFPLKRTLFRKSWRQKKNHCSSLFNRKIKSFLVNRLLINISHLCWFPMHFSTTGKPFLGYEKGTYQGCKTKPTPISGYDCNSPHFFLTCHQIKSVNAINH